MTTFFVGQRVKILWSDGWPELAGSEGTVIGRMMRRAGPNSGTIGYEVAPDKWGTSRAPYIGKDEATHFAPSSSQLEPILPSGHTAGHEGVCEELDKLLAGEIA